MFPKENIILLKNIFRQKDEKYLKILNEIRNGKMYRSSLNLLLENVNKKRPDDIQPTKLYPRRNKVDMFNQIEMDKLTGESRIFTMQQILDLPLSPLQQLEKSKYSVDQINRELQYIENSLLMNKNVELKVGSQVMCTINTETPDGYQLCNGSRGVITSFQLSGIPVVLFKEGFEIPIPPHVWVSETIPGIGISHMPLILAWAMSIHKSQGMSIDVAEIDAGEDIFECGQTYVALSRVKSLEGLYLSSFDVTKIKMNNKVKEFYNKIVTWTFFPSKLMIPYVGKENELRPIVTEQIGFFFGKNWRCRRHMKAKLEKEGIIYINREENGINVSISDEKYLHLMLSSEFQYHQYFLRHQLGQ